MAQTMLANGIYWSQGLDRATIVDSLGHVAGNILMKKALSALAALLALTSAALSFAQDAPLRGVGLLALNASDSHSGLGNVSASSSNLIETPDGGGGGMVPRSARGGGDIDSANANATSIGEASTAPMVPDALPLAVTVKHGRPAVTAPAPKHPSYRWQSLVPGAIK